VVDKSCNDAPATAELSVSDTGTQGGQRGSAEGEPTAGRTTHPRTRPGASGDCGVPGDVDTPMPRPAYVLVPIR
jgi:hypothetical protein